MPKSKKTRRKSKQSIASRRSLSDPIPVPLTFWQKIGRRMFVALTVLAAITGIITAWPTIMNFFMTDRNVYQNDAFVKGELKGPKIEGQTFEVDSKKSTVNPKKKVISHKLIELVGIILNTLS